MWMNESCHTYEWVMSRIGTARDGTARRSCEISCRTYECVWISNVTYMNEWVMLHLWLSCFTHRVQKRWRSSRKLQDTTSHIWMRINKSCLTYQCMSHVTPINELCLTYDWGSYTISHRTYECVWTSHVPYMTEWVMSRTWMRELRNVVSHIWMRMHESCNTYEGVISHV